ncbi:MAG: aminopeptidase P family protein [Longimicrobiaceae bacterium]
MRLSTSVFRYLSALLLVAAACAPAAPLGSQAGSAAGRPAPAAGADWVVPQTTTPAPIGREEYARRRSQLAAGMQDGVLVVLGSEEPELDYLPYAQNAPFRYLTGVTEAGAALVMVKSGATVQEHLFVLPRNPEREVWEGARLGTDGAQALTGIAAQTNDRLIPTLESRLPQHRTLYTVTPLPTDAGFPNTLSREQQIVSGLVARHPGTRVVPVGEAMQRLRATKSPTELDLIRRAVHISVLAHREAMRTTQPGMNEFEIHALVEYFFRRYGAERPAYGSIVGSGPNSTTLHYREADRFMNADEVLLMDVGAAYRGYAADVTRTIPVSGRFSPDQRAIYEVVLAAQKAAEAQVRVGATWAELNQAAERELAQGLARLGLIESPTATYRCESARFGNECPQYRTYYMHGLGHGVGLNVHDPDLSYPIGGGAFGVGSAFTLEPGIYVRADALDFLPDTPENRAMIQRLRPAVQRYQNIGVRIEDVYLITDRGVERASEGAPREIAEIEALMAQESTYARDRRPELVEWYRATTPR